MSEKLRTRKVGSLGAEGASASPSSQSPRHAPIGTIPACSAEAEAACTASPASAFCNGVVATVSDGESIHANESVGLELASTEPHRRETSEVASPRHAH